jgi:hypothetical protein
MRYDGGIEIDLKIGHFEHLEKCVWDPKGFLFYMVIPIHMDILVHVLPSYGATYPSQTPHGKWLHFPRGDSWPSIFSSLCHFSILENIPLIFL